MGINISVNDIFSCLMKWAYLCPLHHMSTAGHDFGWVGDMCKKIPLWQGEPPSPIPQCKCSLEGWSDVLADCLLMYVLSDGGATLCPDNDDQSDWCLRVPLQYLCWLDHCCCHWKVKTGKLRTWHCRCWLLLLCSRRCWVFVVHQHLFQSYQVAEDCRMEQVDKELFDKGTF